MPTSHSDQISTILGLVESLEPDSVLDLGVGFGKYGLLMREYLDVQREDYGYSEWRRRIEGVEAFPEYLTPVHEFIYDEIHVGNMVEVLPRLTQRYDLAILIDVLEHLDYEDGCRVFEECRRVARNLLVSTPMDIGEQGEVFDNPWEEHRFQWQPEHFSGFPSQFRIRGPGKLIIFAGEDADEVKRRFRDRSLKRIKKRHPMLKLPVNLARRLLRTKKRQ